ncbi:hypothetical protein JCGZ_03435 [Jatropha curcas]|uniref:DC1 domain-containing protein n=2 Tax=Jatropha curcas TaxID=180498 RepID=A0A067L719_JATCU|nr:uncharacterized protein LOC105632300 isoform X2 [Jatropha curcas]KDP39904.1 hypothetical protein JCGZ_03435 [Jatropha curcas]
MEALEQRIEHFFHQCPLILLTTPSYRCDGCDKDFSGLTFRCGKCYFQLCVECALLPAIESDFHTKIQHFLHRHPLILAEKKVTDKVYCYECGECCRGNTYGCIKCNFFLHKSCAKLPHEIESAFHPEHPLSLLHMSSQNSEIVRRCDLCLKICSHFAFCCEKCNFVLDVECASLKPTIKYQGHDHDLTVVEKIHDELECDACYSSCKDLPAFRCVECNFDIHLLCGPLPCKIKHKCHVDPLTLKDYYVEDEDEDDEFYCDACEQRRDPRFCVYYCKQGCPMVCDVKCVMSEVIASLRGERGDVELRVVGRHMISRVFSKDLASEEREQTGTDKVATKEKVKIIPTRSLDDIVDSLDPTEQSELNDIATAMKTKSKATLESNKNQVTLPYSEEAFTQFMNLLDSSILKYELPNFIQEHDFTSVGDYLVSQTLIPTFQDLFAKYGDVSAKSTFSPKLKSIVFCFLCSVIHSMQTTKVVDITEDILQEWWACLKFVQLAGFKIQSIIDHVKRVARAYFVLQARMFTDYTSVEKNEEIEQISSDIKVLTVKLEEIKEQQEHNKLNAQAATASLMKQFLRDASAMKWKPAAHGLL